MSADYEAGRFAGLREAAEIARNQDRTGREWVPDSLLANIISRVPSAIERRIAELETK